jgi:hypothetical protein
MKKLLEYIFVFFTYVLISIILMYGFKPITGLYWFIGVFIGLVSISFYLLKNYSWVFKMVVALALSSFVTFITTVFNYGIFKPDSNDHYSTDYRSIFALVAPKDKNGEPNLQLVEQISFFLIAYFLLLILISIMKKNIKVPTVNKL